MSCWTEGFWWCVGILLVCVVILVCEALRVGIIDPVVLGALVMLWPVIVIVGLLLVVVFCFRALVRWVTRTVRQEWERRD